MFVDEFLKRTRDLTDAPDMFIKSSAYHLLSYFPGRFCHSSYGRKLRPNVFVILSCVPGRGRRSTIANWNNDITKRVWGHVYGERDEDYSEEAKSVKKIDNEIIEDGTPEGLTDHVVTTKTRVLDIRSSEFGSVLEKMKDGGYAYGLASFYSRLYYGETYSQKLSKRKDTKERYIPKGLYCTMFSGMQEPHLYIKPAMIREGFIRRIILCYVPVEKLSYWKPPLDIGIGMKIQDTIDWASKEITGIFKYFEKTRRDILFDEEAIEEINTISKYHEERVRKIPGDLSIYLQSTWEQLAKLSMLEAIGRKGVLVKHDDVEKAMEFYQPIVTQAEEIINSLSEEKPIVTVRRALDRVYGTIANERIITRELLYRKLHMESKELDGYIATLVAQNRVCVVPGRPTKYQIL